MRDYYGIYIYDNADISLHHEQLQKPILFTELTR